MAFDYSKLRGKIREVFNTQEEFAKALGLSETSITNKLNNNRNFTQSEMKKIIELLSIQPDEVKCKETNDHLTSHKYLN